MKSKIFGLALSLSATFLLAVQVAAADTIVRGFKASSNFQPGSVVALSNNSSDTVELAPANNPSRVYGVVVDPSTASVIVKTASAQVYVATSGSYPVLVSTQNGTIKRGDYLSLSAADGIAAKSTADQSYVVGQAAGNFDGTSGVLAHQSDGSAIGRINAAIAIGQNPFAKKGDTYVPKVLQRVGQTLAGKPVSVLRIYSALTMFAVTLLISTLLLLGGIKNGMISIGRNPLSQHSVMLGLVQVITAAIAVLIIGLSGVYLLLKI